MYRPIKGRASARLRRAAIVSLLAAGSIASAGDPVESKAPQPAIKSNPFVDTGTPRIVAVRPVKIPKRESEVRTIPSRASANARVIRQTEFTNPLVEQDQDQARDPESVLVRASKIKLNPLKDTRPVQNADPVKKVVERVVPTPVASGLQPKVESEGVSFSISDDTIEMSNTLPEPTLVHGGSTKIIEVDVQPNDMPVERQGSAPIWKVPDFAKQNIQAAPMPAPLAGDLAPKQEFASEMPSVVVDVTPEDAQSREGQSNLEMIGSSGPQSLQEARSSIVASEPAIESTPLATSGPMITPAPLRVVETLKQNSAQPETPTLAEPIDLPVPAPKDVAAIDALVDQPIQAPPAKLEIHAKCQLSSSESKPLFIADRVVKVSVEEPSVCEALTGAGDTLVLIGRKTGTTRIAVWTRSTPNLKPLVYEVSVDGPTGDSEVDENVVMLRSALRKTFPNDSLRVSPVKDGYRVSGTTKTELEAKKIMHLVRSICLEPIQDSIKVR